MLPWLDLLPFYQRPKIFYLVWKKRFKKVMKLYIMMMNHHTSFERMIQQKKWTWNATYLGSFGTHSGFNSFILLNKKTSLFGVGSQHTQPIRPKFGGFFCLCTTGPQKRLVFLFYNMYEMKPEWVPNDPRWVAFHVLFFCWIILSNEVWLYYYLWVSCEYFYRITEYLVFNNIVFSAFVL